jgi:hypothetical protein
MRCERFTLSRFRNQRYSRLGNLRYAVESAAFVIIRVHPWLIFFTSADSDKKLS